MWAKQKQFGFTIVELLIVIVVIAILAAISVVAYRGIQDRTQSSILQNDLTAAKKKLMLYKVDQGKYPLAANLSAVGIVGTKSAYDTTANNFYYCYNIAADEFAMSARTANSKTPYGITSSANVAQISGSSSNGTCILAGLTGDTDANSSPANGYSVTTSTWNSWVGGN